MALNNKHPLIFTRLELYAKKTLVNQYFAAIPGEATTRTNVLPYLSVIIITALLCSTLVAIVYLVVRRRREVIYIERSQKDLK